MLDQNPDALVVRARIQGPPLTIEDPRLVLFHSELDCRQHSKIVAALSKAMAPRMPPALAAKLSKVSDKKDHAAERVAHDLLMKIDDHYKAELDRCLE